MKVNVARKDLWQCEEDHRNIQVIEWKNPQGAPDVEIAKVIRL